MSLFTLTTSGYFYKKDKAQKLEKLGFKFKKCDDNFTKAIDPIGIEISTLGEMLSLAKEYGEIIISFRKDGPEIEIYDDYRE